MINEFLKLAFGSSCRLEGSRSLGGGCINNATRVVTNKGLFFIKWNANAPEDMFEKEAQGLASLSESDAIGVPAFHFRGKLNGVDFMILEFLESGLKSSNYWTLLGEELAALHRCNAENHGLQHDNYIGRLPQSNQQHTSWVAFFRKERLQRQMELAQSQGLMNPDQLKQFDKLYHRLPELIPEANPSLMHGDLWSGNVHVGPDGKAWLIDPAVYYGHREMELAFTTMFGGFQREFYQAYDANYPLEPGHTDRIDLYNLYPLLVHLNMFGTSYLSGILQTLRRYT